MLVRDASLRLAVSSTLAMAIAMACSADPPAAPPGSTDDAGAAGFLPDARAGAGDGSAAMSTMRVAHLASDVGAIDYCYQAAHAGTAIGPVLSALSPTDAGTDADADAELPTDAEAGPSDLDLDAGSADGFATYRTVTKYSNLAVAGPITLSIVAAGSTSCANPLAVGDITLDPGKLSTVALFGRRADGGTSLEIAAFTDDRTTASDKARVRIIHASLGRGDYPAVTEIAVRAVGSRVISLADAVEPRKAATPSDAVPVDDLGYATATPLPNPIALAIGQPGFDGGVSADADAPDGGFAAWESVPADLDLRGGSLHTAFVLTRRTHFEVLWCADTTTSGNRTTCTTVR